MAAARLLKVPGTWAQTVAGTTCGAGFLHRVGCWHQRQSGLPVRAYLIDRTDHHAHCSVYYLYHLVRRPRLILDFTLTLLLNHLVLTTYYSAAIPTSLFFWIVLLASSSLTLLFAEQMCVKREMSEGLVIATNSLEAGDVEMSALRRD